MKDMTEFNDYEVGFDIPAKPGMKAADIQTPALVLDLDALERNIRKMGDYARAHGMRHRVHGKMHKSVDVAKLQIELGGACGVCCQKVSEAEVFARRQLRHVGLGALTSMFQFDATNRDRFSDFRPAVHDSDGLLIHNGAGETLWRPLANPRELQLSAFRDNDPRGFGLMQRSQDFDDFSDLEALYHRRPSVWIVPRGGWGRGAVTLVEIPTEDEIYDNIVAYWRPDTPVEGGGSLAFAYDMSWSGATAWGNGLRVIDTRAGQVRSDGIIFAVDFENGPDLPADLGEVRATVRSSAGEVSTGILQRNPSTGGARFSFTLRPGTATLAEMRAELRTADGAALSETWLYRWTAE